MAKTSSGDLGGFDPVFKYLVLFVQALFSLRWASFWTDCEYRLTRCLVNTFSVFLLRKFFITGLNSNVIR